MSEFELPEKRASDYSEILQRLARADTETRVEVQKMGVDVIPMNFYSTVPSVDEIENSYEYSGIDAPYLDAQIFSSELMQKTLQQLLEFAPEFNPPAAGDEESPEGFFWDNSQFSYSDAMSYYCFLRMLKPANLVEIGSGFSTLAAIDAIEKNGYGRVRCIEPFPRQFLRQDKRIDLDISKAQDIDSDSLNEILHDGDVLFIDSTHTVKTGSDCLHIYLRLLPKIKRDIHVHVHDIFLPFGMPKSWLMEHQCYWTEQYLLLAFLIDNPKARVIYGSAYNAEYNQALMQQFMDGKCGAGGASLWFRYEGSKSVG